MAEQRQRVVGRLSMHPRGFAFLATAGDAPDVFIPPSELRGAMHGDLVEAQVRPSARGAEGRVVSIRERWLRFVTGTVFRAHRGAYLQPDDARLNGSWSITGDVPALAEQGATVTAAIVEYPRGDEGAGKVRIVDVLGTAGETSVEVAKIKLQEGIVEMFPEAVQQEAAALPTSVRPSDRRGREDLRDYDLVTIDPEDARDHDDALWAARLPGGGFRLWVAIADVSHYVPFASAIDGEALNRGCSIYLPDRAIPMLPAELSSGLASLVPDKDRLCMAIELHLDERGKVRQHRIVEGIMRSRARLTYGGAARALGLSEQAEAQPAAKRFLPLLETLRDLAALLQRRRQRRGTIEFALPEPRVRLDENAEPIDVTRAKGDPGIGQAYKIVEEMMLLANETIAAELTKRQLPAIYRVHGKPLEDRLLLFLKMATALGFRSASGEPIDASITEDPKALAQLSRRMHKHPRADILHYLLLRAMQQATYSVDNIGHFGLAAAEYLHFTSPIRRYPDLAVHRVVRAMLRETADPGIEKSLLRQQAMESSRLERRAATVERAVLELYRTLLMRRHLGEELPATVASVDSEGFTSTLDAPFVEVKTSLDRLAGHYELDELGLRLSARSSGAGIAVGDRITLRIESADLAKRLVTAVPIHLKLAAEGEKRRRSLRRERPGKAAHKPGSKAASTGSKPARGSSKRRRRR